jgi:hypothetical protein
MPRGQLNDSDTLRGLAPDVLAVQEVGDRLDGYEHLATATPDGRGIRVGYLSRLPLHNVREITAFSDRLRPVQIDDTETDATSLGRAGLVGRRRTHRRAGDLPPEAEAADLPRRSVLHDDEGGHARFGAYALNRRAAKLLAEQGQQRA